MRRKSCRFHPEEIARLAYAISCVNQATLREIDKKLTAETSAVNLEAYYNQLREDRALYERLHRMMPEVPTAAKKRKGRN